MKKGTTARLRGALARLEANLKEFKAAGEDKKPRTSTRTNKHGLVVTVEHKAVPFKVEVARMEREIATIKTRLEKVVS